VGSLQARACSAYAYDMQDSTREVTSTAGNALVWAITLGAIALLAAVLAYWTWMWLAPAPEASLAYGPTTAHSEATHGLFGAEAPDAPTGTTFTLLGIAASTGAGQGRAIVQLDGRKTLVAGVGEEIAPGVRVSEISTTHVVLDRGGAAEKLELPRRPPAPVTAPQARQQ
jgi:general secretion pathway protein C